MPKPPKLKPCPKTIAVCDKCFKASCWHGTWMCDKARHAGTIEKTIKELKKLKLEDSHYWKKQCPINPGKRKS